MTSIKNSSTMTTASPTTLPTSTAPLSRHDLYDPLDTGGGDESETPNGSSPPMIIGPYPSYTMGPMEILLIVLLFVVWFYAIKRIYTVWSNVLNFSALSADIPGRQPKGRFANLSNKFPKKILCGIILALKKQ